LSCIGDLDGRANGGFIVLPRSAHESCSRYYFEAEPQPLDGLLKLGKAWPAPEP
jgi:hypothetical protein